MKSRGAKLRARELCHGGGDRAGARGRFQLGHAISSVQGRRGIFGGIIDPAKCIKASHGRQSRSHPSRSTFWEYKQKVVAQCLLNAAPLVAGRILRWLPARPGMQRMGGRGRGWVSPTLVWCTEAKAAEEFDTGQPSKGNPSPKQNL